MTSQKMALSKEFPLHQAILDDSIEDLELLLRTPHVNINLQNEFGETPLLLSLKRQRSNSFIMHFIRAGCDVNIPDIMGVTPLHVAVSLSLNDIACELINRSANTNAQEKQESITDGGDSPNNFNDESFNKKTPLLLAVQCNNLEGVCMLLYYGADVHNTTSDNGITLLMLAASKRLEDIVKILINYYDESYYLCGSVDSYFDRPPFKLVLAREIAVLLTHCVQFKNADIFKLFCSIGDFENNLNLQDANFLLATFLKHSEFSTSDWLECLHLILYMFVANKFIIHYKKHPETFFYHLFNACDEKKIELTDKLVIINVCLSLDAPVWINDIEDAHERFGFKEEVERFIYSNISYEDVSKLSLHCYFILSAEEDFVNTLRSEVYDYFNYEFLFSLFQSSKRIYSVVRLLGYFSLPADLKDEIEIYGEVLDERDQIFEKLEQVPEFPSLLELSRNRVRKCLKPFSKLKYPYHYHDAVKKLNLPKLVEDIIRFKIPIY